MERQSQGEAAALSTLASLPLEATGRAGLGRALDVLTRRAHVVNRRVSVAVLWPLAGSPATTPATTAGVETSDRDRERDAARGHACAAFCDTDFTKEGSVRLTASALADEAARIAAGEGGAPPVDLIVLTGGEPLLQADASLVQALHEQGLEVAVETNGTVRLADAFGEPEHWPDWVVCSPKLPAEQTVIETLDELKLVVPAYRPADYAAVADRVRPHRIGARTRRFLWVQPEDGPRLNDARHLAVALAQADPRWRVSTQTHKLLHVD